MKSNPPFQMLQLIIEKIVRSQLCLLVEILLNEALRKRNSIDISIRVFYDTIIDRKLNVVKIWQRERGAGPKFYFSPAAPRPASCDVLN
jgi:hypothetical protein